MGHGLESNRLRKDADQCEENARGKKKKRVPREKETEKTFQRRKI